MIISDLFDDVEAIVSGLEHLRFRNHEVLIFHVLDPWERDLPLEGNIRFHDLESGEELISQAEGIRERYRKAVRQWCETLDAECRNRGIQRIEMTTDDPLDRVLLDYLVKRARSY